MLLVCGGDSLRLPEKSSAVVITNLLQSVSDKLSRVDTSNTSLRRNTQVVLRAYRYTLKTDWLKQPIHW